jgi:hypothetical protein
MSRLKQAPKPLKTMKSWPTLKLFRYSENTNDSHRNHHTTFLSLLCSGQGGICALSSPEIQHARRKRSLCLAFRLAIRSCRRRNRSSRTSAFPSHHMTGVQNSLCLLVQRRLRHWESSGLLRALWSALVEPSHWLSTRPSSTEAAEHTSRQPCS